MQSEFLGLHIASVANDQVKQDDARLFAFHAVWRTYEGCVAMLADASHDRKQSKGSAIGEVGRGL